jgi:lipopolysaccharide transport system permease protein
MTLSNLADAFLLKLRFNLKAEARKHYLNYAWWFLEPALQVAVFYVVFDILLNRGGDGFVVFLICGQIPFMWFSRSVLNASNSIMVGRGLIQQMAIPKAFFPALAVAQDLVKQGVVFACLLTFVTAMGYLPGVTWLSLPILAITQLLLILACSLIAAAITPFLPDFRFVVQTGLMMLMFGSGIFYDYRTTLLDEHKTFFLLNPMARLIDSYRTVLIRDTWPDWTALAWLSIACVVVIIVMLSFYRRIDSVYARLVIQ